MKLHATRIDHLSYGKAAEGVWRIVDTTDGRNAVVGPIYTSMSALLEDFDAYYARSWAPNRKKTVAVVFGETATDHWAEECVSQEVKDGLQEFEFDTQAEVDAFVMGLKTMAGWEEFLVVTDEEADRIKNEDAVDPNQDDDDEEVGEDEEGKSDVDGAEEMPSYPTSVEDHAARFPDQIFVRVSGSDVFDTQWEIDCNLTDRWGQINPVSSSELKHDLWADPVLLERLREQMFDEFTFIARKDGTWGVLFELEINTIESEEGQEWEGHYPLKSRAEREREVMEHIAKLAQQYPAVEFACPHAYAVELERSALWAFVADGVLTREQIDALGNAILDFGYGPLPVMEGV